MRLILIAVLVLMSACARLSYDPERAARFERAYDRSMQHRQKSPNFGEIRRNAESGPRAADTLGQCRMNSIYTQDGRYVNCQTCCSGSSCNTSCY